MILKFAGRVLLLVFSVLVVSALTPLAVSAEPVPEGSSAKNLQPKKAKAPVQLVREGEYHASDVIFEKESGWLGLVRRNGRYFIDELKVKIERIEDYIGPDAEGKKIEVLSKNGEVLFLLKDVLGLSKGEVEFAHHLTGPIYPGQQFNIVLNEKGLNYLVYAKGETAKPDTNRIWAGIENYKLFIGDSRFFTTEPDLSLKKLPMKKQLCEIKNFDEASPPSILWAGDLNKDSKLDLIVSRSRHYNNEVVSLYLSSPKSKDPFPVEVAKLDAMGC